MNLFAERKSFLVLSAFVHTKIEVKVIKEEEEEKKFVLN